MRLHANGSFSGMQLKYFAAFFMVVDHADVLFHFMGGVADPDSLWFLFPRFLGRFAFPVFVFFMAEGCRNTHDFPAYLKRLFLFAVLAQIPFSLAFSTLGGSVILTFFLGALAIYCFERFQHKALAWLCVLGSALTASLLQTDYGWQGVLLMFLLYLCGASRKKQILVLALGMIYLYFVENLLLLVRYALLNMVSGPLQAVYIAQLPPVLMMTFFALLGVIPVCFYNGQRGTGSKWFFYWFYPGHILLLWLIRTLMPT